MKRGKNIMDTIITMGNYMACYKEAFIIGLIVGLALRIKYVSVK
jgi:hypothetical protein